MLPDPDRLLLRSDDIEGVGNENALLSSAFDAVEHARRFEPARLAQVLTTFAHLLARNGQYERARSAADEVLKIEQKTNSVVEATIVLGICAANTNQIDTAEQYFQQAAEISRKINYPAGLARALQYLSSQVLLVRGKFHLALTLIEEAAILHEELGSKHWNEPFLRGLIYQMVGDRRHCRQILDELVLQVEPGTSLAAAYYFLWARLALDEEEMEQAREYLRLGLRVANRIGVADLSLWIRLEFSRYHRLRNEAPFARTWAEDALHLAQQLGSQYFTGLAQIELAQASWEAGDKASAKSRLDEAQHLLEPLGAAYDLAQVKFLHAVWSRLDRRPDSEDVWLQAVNSMVVNGYAFILEKEQDQAFPLIAAHIRSKTPKVRQATEELMRHLANVPPPLLRFATLGQFAVWKGRRRIPDQSWNRRKAGELLRYLLLQPTRAAGREVIIEALWPDHESDNLSDMLHQSTSALRHALEPDLPDKFPSRYLKVEGEQISLLLPPGSVVDFEHFEQALPLAIQARNIDRLQEALNLYSGDLFPSDRYADWSEEKRQSLAELRQRGLLALGQAYLEQGQHFQAITCCRQVLHVDTWNEDAVLLVMKAYAGLQDVPHALQAYLQLERILHEELDIAPRQDLRELADTLRKR